jgi:hypothetical protein
MHSIMAASDLLTITISSPSSKFFGAHCVSFDNHAASACWIRSAELSLTTLGGGLRPSNSVNAVVGQTTSGEIGRTVLALPFGAKIGPAQPFKGGYMAVGFGSTTKKWYGQWANKGRGVKNHYFGFKFKGKDAKLNYGWVRMTVNATKDDIQSVLVSGIAYETIANNPIIARKTKGPHVIALPMDTGMLGHLARGKK